MFEWQSRRSNPTTVMMVGVYDFDLRKDPVMDVRDRRGIRAFYLPIAAKPNLRTLKKERGVNPTATAIGFRDRVPNTTFSSIDWCQLPEVTLA